MKMDEKMKRNILIFAKHYIPSVKAGGPVISLKNLVDNLSENFNFFIVTEDRDFKDSKPFDDIKTHKWTDVNNAKVYYIPRNELNFFSIAKICNNLNYDLIYLNGVFTIKFSIAQVLLKTLKIIPNKPIVIAPRGEFAPGALKFRTFLKRLYIGIIKIFALDKHIIWHATAQSEKANLQALFRNNNNIIVASNMTANYQDFKFNKQLEKKSGELKIISLSRIHPIKNIKTSIALLQNIKGTITFNIYGPMEDKKYWTECKREIANLDNNITVIYHGCISHSETMKIFNENHVFLLPTLGENFGHVISEAMIGGCPVIISDKTPWRDLQKHNAGWDISLSDNESFLNAINFCINLDNNEYKKLATSAFNYGKKSANNQEEIDVMTNIFNTTL